MSNGNGKVHEAENTLMAEYKFDYGRNYFKAGAVGLFYGLKDLDFNMSGYIYNPEENKLVIKTYKENMDTVGAGKNIKISSVYLENMVAIKNIYIKPGVNFSYCDLLQNNKSIVDPRITLSYEINQDSNIKFSTGKYSRHPMNGEQTSNNKDLKPENTIHYVAGYEKQFEDKYRFRSEVYYKDMKDLIVSDPDGENEKEDGEIKSIYKNVGEGFSKGMEFFLKKKETKDSRFDGWISYTYAITKKKLNSKYQKDWFYPYQDQRHTLNVVGNYYLVKNDKWDVALRAKLDYYSGRPVQNTEIVKMEDVEFDGKKETIYIEAPIADSYSRLYDYLRMDLTLEHMRKHEKFDVGGFLQVINVTNHKNTEGKSVELFTGKEVSEEGFGMMFVGGFKFRF